MLKQTQTITISTYLGSTVAQDQNQLSDIENTSIIEHLAHNGLFYSQLATEKYSITKLLQTFFSLLSGYNKVIRMKQ